MQICDHGNGHCWCPNIVNELTHLSPGRCGNYLKSIMFILIIQNNSWGAHCKIVFRWMAQNLTSEKSTLVQVMVWCCQATNHYLDQCCPRSLMRYGIIRLWWINVEKGSINEHWMYPIFCCSLQTLLSLKNKLTRWSGHKEEDDTLWASKQARQDAGLPVEALPSIAKK